MLKKFAVENYRGFRNRVEMDLSKVGKYRFHPECIHNDLIGKCMIIGHNGCGKTDFGLALFDIVSVLTDLQTDDRQKDAFGFLNGDSDLPYAAFTYTFDNGNDDIVYEYRKSTPDTITYEKLEVGGNLIFMRFGDDSDYSGLPRVNAGDLRIDVRDGPLSVLGFIANNTDQPPGSAVSGIMDFVKGMLYVRSVRDGNAYIGLTRGSESPSDYIVRNGCVEDFNDVVRNMAGLDIELDVVKAEGAPERLVIKTEHKRLDFERSASSGTKLLMLHYYWFRHLGNVTFLYLDEFDAYYHFELAERILRRLSEEAEIQCVFTSHNTSLVSNRILRPDCYLYLDSRGMTPLPELTDREIREGHNLEKLLRGGEFDE